MRDTILCLCDLTGVMARPWVEHGYHAVLVDPQHGVTSEDGAYLKLACTIVEAFDQISGLVRSGRLAFVAGFPPCTDMAVSGAQWFPRKYEADHLFQAKAVSVAEQCRVIGEMSGKDRANNRSKTPLGFARAVYEVNQGKATEE